MVGGFERLLTRGRKISEKHDKVFVTGCLEPKADGPRANAVLVVLARNQELAGVVQSIKSIERHFNRWFHYPYVFLNDAEFNVTFKETMMNHTSGTVEFGKIDPDMWGYPDWVNKETAKEGIGKQGDAAIMYGGMESYHHMCRFYSGFVDPPPAIPKLHLTAYEQLLLQARASTKVRLVLEGRAGYQILL